MAVESFLHENSRRSYPLQRITDETVRQLLNPFFLDAGFSIVQYGQLFDYEQHEIGIPQIAVSGTDIQLSFALALDASHVLAWAIAIDTTVHEWGQTYRTHTSGVDAWVTIGDTDQIIALGDGAHSFDGAFEPALIYVPSNVVVTQVQWANVRRSSEAAHSEIPSAERYLLGYSLTPPERDTNNPSSDVADVILEAGKGIFDDALTFVDGFNAHVATVEVTNTVEFSGLVGFGEGVPCIDITVDDSGISFATISEACTDYVCTINRAGGNNREFTLTGGPGIEIVPDPENHTVRIALLKYQIYVKQ